MDTIQYIAYCISIAWLIILVLVFIDVKYNGSRGYSVPFELVLSVVINVNYAASAIWFVCSLALAIGGT